MWPPMLVAAFEADLMNHLQSWGGCGIWMLLALAAGTAAMSRDAAASILYVDDDGPAKGDGLNWATAYRFPNDAIAAAALPGSGVTEIRFGKGTYRPDRGEGNPLGSGDREAHFSMLAGVAFRGGYLGLEAGKDQSPDDRDVDAYQTILSGDLAGDDDPNPGIFDGSDENAFQVVVAVNVGDDSALDGFTITRGRADGVALGAVPASMDQGAGLNIYFSSPIIINCTFHSNYSSNHGAINDHGDETQVIDCIFHDNASTLIGAGLYVHHHSMTTARGCLFINNHTDSDGAGAYTRSMHGAMFEDCLFADNTANKGGGMYHAPESATMVINCSFIGNSAVAGGGLYAEAASPMITGSMWCGNEAHDGAGIKNTNSFSVIENCMFANNNAAFIPGIEGGGGSGGSGGGGVWNEGGNPIVRDCTFTANLASFGGGVYNGGLTTAQTIDCTFTDNITFEGGGVYNINCNSPVRGCTFIRNIAVGGIFSVGGAISNYFVPVEVSDCAFQGNHSELGGGAVYNEGDFPRMFNCAFAGNTTSGFGGGIWNSFYSATEIANCTFSGNVADQGGGAMNNFIAFTMISNCVAADNFPDDIVQDAASSVVMRHSLMPGGWSGLGEFNINASPLFLAAPDPGGDGEWGTVDDAYGDLRLAAGSPGIDAGDNAALPDEIDVDLAGEARFADDLAARDCPQRGADCGSAPIVDMGAYERQPVAPEDLNGDGQVNGFDLALLLSQWGRCPNRGVCAADFNHDGIVSGMDLAILLAAWG
jgi:hypothetical protein